MKKLQRLGIGLGLTFALMSGTGYGQEKFTVLQGIPAEAMRIEEMASVQGGTALGSGYDVMQAKYYIQFLNSSNRRLDAAYQSTYAVACMLNRRQCQAAPTAPARPVKTPSFLDRPSG